MPTQNYPIGGIVKDSSGNVVSGATVTCFNVNTKEWLKSSAQIETNSLGEYTIDLYNLDEGYSNLDTIQILAITDPNKGSITHSVNTVIGFLNKDIYLRERGNVLGNMDISNMVDQIGSNISISEVSSTLNTRGDATETETKYLSYGVVEVIVGDEEIVSEGLLEKNDIIIYIDYFAPAADKLSEHGYIYYNGIKYIIKSINDNKSHYEILCKAY